MEFFRQHSDLNSNSNNEEACLPVGFRFRPTDEELIKSYLLLKVLDGSFTGGWALADIDLYKFEPWELPQKAKMRDNKEWFFFNLRDRKYHKGMRFNRCTQGGYWRSSGGDCEVYCSKTSDLIGLRKTLVFYHGRDPNAEKTNWLMHEYRLGGAFAYHHFLPESSKDEWVISRVFEKSTSAATVGVGGKKWCSSAVAVSGSLPLLLYDSAYTAEQVYSASCFSTASTTTCLAPYQWFLDFPLPEAMTSSFDACAPILSTLPQENFFYSSSAAPVMDGGGGGETSNHSLGLTELDSIWRRL